MLLLEKSQALEAHKTRLDSEVRQLTSRLSTAEASVRANESAAASVPELSASVQHLRADCARLVKLLASTQEYRQFVA